ncbi:DUF5947 family protein [Streptomyces meridianus]|uniref:DUF5947 family protein n=1 Tax=Streptomyces meridianus TaxID=2938945 RepID=A0ABT0X561_9ACTN|nr:DUF5947 family protein [Streptomyces meridianus]MCM2577673.1 DUF5947 family protein [Streptomyces meridianus]
MSTHTTDRGRTGRRGLRRFLEPAQPRPERCELCGTNVPQEHRHLVDEERRSLACACTPCAMLFDRPGASTGRFRSLPGRILTDPGFGAALGPADWEALRVPVSIAFFFRNSELGRPVAFYPSPAGATESELDPEAWESVLGRSPLAEVMLPDTEALLVRRTPGSGDDDRSECYLVPVDLAYALVGRMRLHWQGFDGGAQAHAELAAFFDDLARRATEVPREDGET